MVKYIKVFKGAEKQNIEQTQLDRFIENGWHTQQSSQNKILKADATVRPTAIASESKNTLLAQPEDNQTPSEEYVDDLDDIAWEIDNLKEEKKNGDTNR
tara:strand:- start:492 stop:788 length:297 start_codon:yes stop_codon:yes gene_type:complete